MKSVLNKTETLRTAVAQSVIKASPEAIIRLRQNDLPKKDVLIVARVAGVLAAKKTHELIPYCHPIFIDHVEIEYEVLEDQIRVKSTVQVIAKTGVEMEALTASSVAALTIYDMLKPVDKNMEIVSTKLLEKTGGKSSFFEKIPKDLKVAVIVSSDSTAKGTRSDKSGRIIEERLKTQGITPEYVVLPDDAPKIKAKMEEFIQQGVKLIITTGGTGLGPRDVTVEATREVIDREIPGIMEAARSFGQRRTPYAMLSRGLAGQKGGTIIVNLPGSSRGVEESLDAIFPAILHAYKMMGGGGHG
jgi:molybdenum cofactor biosynthesis protein MoaC